MAKEKGPREETRTFFVRHVLTRASNSYGTLASAASSPTISAPRSLPSVPIFL